MASNLKSYTPEETWQKLLDDVSSGLNVDPESMREYFMSNIVMRTISMLYGIEPISGDLRKLQCTRDGRLQVTSVANIFTLNSTHDVSLAVSASQAITFPSTVTRIDFWSYDNPFNIVRVVSGIPNQPAFSFPGGGFYSIDASTDGLELTNPSNSVTVTGQIIGWS